MFRYSLSWYIFAFTLLESIIKTHLTFHDSSHGFISNNQRYDLNDLHEEITSGLRSARINDAAFKLQLKFEPAFLDFKYRQLGVPHLEKVTLFNVDSNKSIDMTSISGSTVHFHSSFFEDKKIPPLGNTTFNVVFLGREEGFVESSLFIHTTEGHFKYNVKGSSIYSPYRLRPIVAIKLPVNASFSPLIYMHNPHIEPIQIVEVYSSGGDFHLELPSGDLEGPKDIWEIAPLQTKAVIRVRFVAKSEQNHTAYVRIKLNSTDEILVVPLEVEVSSNGGIFDPRGSIDFGIGGSLDPPKRIDLCVYNPLKKAVRIHSVAVSSQAIKVNYENVKLLPENGGGCVKIGTLSLDWSSAFQNMEFSGKVTVKYKNGKSRSEIPFYLTVLDGGLSYDPLNTRYFIDDKSEGFMSRELKIKNNFQAPVQIINFTLPDEVNKFFKIDNFQVMTMKPQQEASVLSLKLKAGINVPDLRVNSHIIVHTNISDLIIPILSYNGRLELQLPFKSKDNSLDLGLIGFDTLKEFHFLVGNANPVGIDIKNLKTSIPMTISSLIGCGKNEQDMALLKVSFRNLTKCSTLKSNEYAIVRLSVQTANNEGQSWGDVQIETQYENLSLPVHFKVANGKLEIGPDRLVFDQCFPYKICSHPLRVHSTFDEPMIIEDVVSLPPDKRLSSQHSGHILARATKIIGHLFLDPTITCGTECYTGLSLNDDASIKWLESLMLPKSVGSLDLNLVNVYYNRYLNLTSNGARKWQNLTLRLDTSEVRGHIFKTRVKMSWPSLLLEQNFENRSVFAFPLTQIGNVSFRNITLRNPASFPLFIQLVLDKYYPEVHQMFEGLPANFIPADYQPETPIKHGFFIETHLKDTPDVYVHEHSITAILKPSKNFTFSVGFRSEDTTPNSGLIFIRNNLTIIEVVKIKAQGAQPLFKFGNRKPGSVQPLSFELTEKHLKDCEKERGRGLPAPNLTVRRSFTARNIGEVTIFIHGFFINNHACEGYGFQIMNCAPFVLHPNATKKIDIAFTPDFTLSKVTRTLVLETSLNFPVSYTLHSTIPPYYLGLCSSLIQRPFWENYLSFSAIILMYLLFIIIFLIAFLDADRVKRQTISSLMAPSNLSVQPVLDLRLVGQQTRAEIRTPVASPKVEEKRPDEAKKEEKMPVLVPVTGRSKRKLAKKNSNEVIQENDAQKKPNDLAVVQTSCSSNLNKKKPDERKSKEMGGANAKCMKMSPICPNASKKVTKTFVPVCEEETLSSSTDCSSNNEENEKELADQCRNTKTCSNKTIKIIQKIETEEISTIQTEQKPLNHPKIERKRSGPKPSYKKDIPSTPRLEICTPESVSPPSKPETTKSHEKKSSKSGNKKIKDHSGRSKTFTCDKSHSKSDKNHRESPPMRVSPPIASPSLWTENRATFSDVVARNEAQLQLTNPVNIANTRPLSQTQTSKPTMYVEPYKQTSSELGPIGSRRSDYWPDEHLDDQSNSFFTNPYDMPQVDGNGYFEGSGPEAWSGYMGMMDASQGSQLEFLAQQQQNQQNEVWHHNLNLQNNACWNSTYRPLAERLQTTRGQENMGQHGYLWGSSPVWQPCAPKMPKTPTRTPPGFDPYPQRNREEEPMEPREGYNPFGTSNIWTHQQQNPWNYQGQ